MFDISKAMGETSKTHGHLGNQLYIRNMISRVVYLSG